MGRRRTERIKGRNGEGRVRGWMERNERGRGIRRGGGNGVIAGDREGGGRRGRGSSRCGAVSLGMVSALALSPSLLTPGSVACILVMRRCCLCFLPPAVNCAEVLPN